MILNRKSSSWKRLDYECHQQRCLSFIVGGVGLIGIQEIKAYP